MRIRKIWTQKIVKKNCWSPIYLLKSEILPTFPLLPLIIISYFGPCRGATVSGSSVFGSVFRFWVWFTFRFPFGFRLGSLRRVYIFHSHKEIYLIDAKRSSLNMSLVARYLYGKNSTKNTLLLGYENKHICSYDE